MGSTDQHHLGPHHTTPRTLAMAKLHRRSCRLPLSLLPPAAVSPATYRRPSCCLLQPRSLVPTAASCLRSNSSIGSDIFCKLYVARGNQGHFSASSRFEGNFFLTRH
ncbi:hypothetical protein L1987_38016 [Smallanthus sonchifolius]|uniref:Uncharacterized protein n=1 Tax=Smallanthus sonchifolius TaxID=185202 RepID=A0ACB9HI11_9ASTR|nr:hypothetical protein L1987_38016 [Smallanthus sonchifolius]